MQTAAVDESSRLELDGDALLKPFPGECPKFSNTFEGGLALRREIRGRRLEETLKTCMGMPSWTED